MSYLLDILIAVLVFFMNSIIVKISSKAVEYVYSSFNNFFYELKKRISSKTVEKLIGNFSGLK